MKKIREKSHAQKIIIWKTHGKNCLCWVFFL
jgi:hypothetical protein